MAANFPSEDTAKNAVKVWSIVKSIKVAMMTVGRSDTAQSSQSTEFSSRPMRALFEDPADAIWFIVPRSDSTRRANGVPTLLTFSGGADGDHVAFQGMTALVEDSVKLKALWNGHADIAFPKGPGDANAALLKFQPTNAEFWAGGTDTLSFVINFLEAKMTGNAPVVGEHAVVRPT